MKYIFILLLVITSLNASSNSVKEKKKKFINDVLPAIERVYTNLQVQYNDVKEDMQHSRNIDKKETLMHEYNAKTDEELLMALKPHPKSIALAQAAIESAWGTSRFYSKANNIFGIWSYNKNEPRIPALQKRGNKTIYLKKFNSIDESIEVYYKLLAKAGAYKDFRKVKSQTNDVFIMSRKLDKYCELGAEYCSRIEGVIRYNKFTKYD